MEKLNRNLPIIKIERNMPEKVLMFGEGAFLRAFACYSFDEMNNKRLFDGSVTIVQPIPEGKIELLAKQDGLYNIILRGIKDGEKVVKTRLVTCVNNYINPYTDYTGYIKTATNPHLRFIVSNTTEAGISYREGEKHDSCPQMSFPGKVTAFLHKRFSFFKGDKTKGIIFLPCELIDDNGTKLRELVIKYAKEWNLSAEFLKWIDESCVFANTLVDKIVSGYPSEEADRICEELGFRDELLDACELFYFWAIEGPSILKDELPFNKAGLNVIFSDDISPYRLRKVRILNGAHTCLAPAALLCGLTTVGEAVSDNVFRKYIETAIFKEIIPALDINKNVLESFAKSILERFSNPFIRHELQGITLNSVSKFKTRVLPTILDYQKKFGVLPPVLTFSFAALIAFYKSGGRFKIMDEEKNIAFLRDNKIDVIFKNWSAWDADLKENIQLYSAVENAFNAIRENGIKSEVMRLINE